jgi:hypothetical protein
MFQPVMKENKELHKVTEGTELKITSQQKELVLEESTGKESDGSLQGEDEGLKACLTALIIINNITSSRTFYKQIKHLMFLKAANWFQV